jgi:hypothetical protein
MNERIKKLADKIWAEEYWDNPATDKLLPAQLNKFAELIIRECATELLKWKDEPFPFDEDLAVRLIKDHFGVKE